MNELIMKVFFGFIVNLKQFEVAKTIFLQVFIAFFVDILRLKVSRTF